MSKAMKKTTVALLSAATCFAAAVGIITVSNVKASAADEAVTPTVAAAGTFVTQDGAGIKISKGNPSGIRWTVTMTDSFYQNLNNPKFYTLVNDSAIDLDDYYGNNDRVVVIENNLEPQYDEESKTWTFYSAIVYNQLKAELEEKGYSETEVEDYLTQAYGHNLYARAYVETSDGIVYSTADDVARSIQGVAMNYLIEESANAEASDVVTEENKAEFVKYAGADYTVKGTKTIADNAVKITNMYGE